MYGGSFDAQSNRADWDGAIYLYDGDVGPDEYIDISGCTISLTVSDENGRQCLTASTADGTITFPEDGTFSWNFPASRMASLCVGTYEVGIRIAQDDVTRQLFIGSLPIVEGVDRQ